MASAKKLPSGNWRIQLYLGKNQDGKAIRKSITASTRWECERLADEFLQGRRECNLTVGECIDKYIEMRENVLSPSTVRGYKKIRSTRLQGIMGVKAEQLNSQILQRAVSADALRLSKKSITEAVHLLKSALKVQGIKHDLTVTYPPKKSKIITLPEPESVINAILGTSIELPCLLAICLGLRCSEIRALTKADLQGNILYIHRRKIDVDGVDIIQEINKTDNSCRSIQCPQFLADKIQLCKTDELCPLTYPQLSSRFRRVMRKNQISITFHGLRHLNASVMLVLGVPDKYAMERGGWSSPAVMKSVYQNTFSAERKRADDTVNDYFENIIAHESAHDDENNHDK